MIELERLSRRYGETLAVDDLSLRVARGELLVLLGGSGSGKTTTLKMVNRLIEPSAGCVRIDGRDTRELAPHALRRGIGYCFQQVGLFPHLSVAAQRRDHAAAARLERAAKIAARVDELLQLVELEPAAFRDRRPDQLSGGEQQRVGLARALAAEPEVVLLDEPFGALDPLTRDRLQRWFLALRRRLGFTAIFVTHDMVEALALGDRIAVLNEGRLAQVGNAERAAERAGRRLRRRADGDAAPSGRGGGPLPGRGRPRLGRLMAEQLAAPAGYLTAHLQLTLVALLLAVAIAVPLGIAVARRRGLETPLLGAGGRGADHPGPRAARDHGAGAGGAGPAHASARSASSCAASASCPR